MTAIGLFEIVTQRGRRRHDGLCRAVWSPGEDALENGFIVHRGLYVTGIDEPSCCARWYQRPPLALPNPEGAPQPGQPDL
ncbi:hypothetical protein LT493_26220 [Streptomyces tricolor]|nr:hypothetical protein [Streptomyces tricolor]